MRVLACALALFVFALSGCQMTETTPAATGGPINATCAMKDSEAANADCCVDYKGQKIAFCCKMCKAKFESLSEAEKDARVEAVQKK
jgi:hypothetical protein